MNRAGGSAYSIAAAVGDRRLLTLSPYGVRNPTSGGTKRIFFLNRGYALAGWDVLQISSTSFGRSLRETVQQNLAPLMGRPQIQLAPGYREVTYFNPFVILGNRRLRKRSAAQVSATLLPAKLRPSWRIRRELARHRFVLFEHPHMFDMAAGMLRDDHFVILDAHNIEAALHAHQIDDSGSVGDAARALRDVECRAMRRANLILACSEYDRSIAVTEYGVDSDRILVTPNGADVETMPCPTDSQRQEAKAMLGLDGPTVLFVGSRWGPNVEAASAILDMAANAPDLTWLIVGAVGGALNGDVPANVRVTGPVDDLALWYSAADVAVNPMSSGSGSNIKMFEYLGAGLPVVTTSFGARGVEDDTGLAISVAEIPALPAALRALLACQELPARRTAARRVAEAKYDWNQIAAHVIVEIESRGF